MSTLASVHASYDKNFRRILGVDFFGGRGDEALERMRAGGLLVVPAAPALLELSRNAGYREALLNADLCITDSAYMVMVWNVMEGDSIDRLSGLTYLRDHLLQDREVRRAGSTLWVMPSQKSSELNLKYLTAQGIAVPEECLYVAPWYGETIRDPMLLERVNRLRPRHVVVTLGGGTQEQLGLYLKRELEYSPAIHCIGAAIAFLSGDQVRIPVWADRHYVGWLCRCLADPKTYVPRYWRASKLLTLILFYRSDLPPLKQVQRDRRPT